jgi:hypothetical protein
MARKMAYFQSNNPSNNHISSPMPMNSKTEEGASTGEVVALATLHAAQPGKTRDKNRFKMTTFDILTNPLRQDHPFGKYHISSSLLSKTIFSRYIFDNNLNYNH